MKYFNAIDYIFCILNLFFRIQTIELIDIKNKVRELVANLETRIYEGFDGTRIITHFNPLIPACTTIYIFGLSLLIWI